MAHLTTREVSPQLALKLAEAAGIPEDTCSISPGSKPEIRLFLDEAIERKTACLFITTHHTFEDYTQTRMELELHLHTIDIYPLLKCILVLIAERTELTQHIEENILSALHEAVLNALIHGNLAQHSHYTDSYNMFEHFEAITALLKNKPEPENLTLILEISPEEVTLQLTDQGRGFSNSAIVPPGESALHGRGMSIIHECADSVDIQDGGRTIIMRFAAGTLRREREKKLENAHILIVEDVEVNRLIIRQMLERRGFRNISMAIDGIEALEKTVALKPDLVLLDLLLPRMDGYTYCRKIREHPEFRDLPIVVQTILSNADQRSKAFACGASDLVTKPINAYELVSRITLLLEKQSLLKDLRSYQSRLQSDLQSAMLMQQSIVPSQSLLKQMELRYGISAQAVFQPSHEIGGDIWGIRMLSEGECAVYIIDFSGHGITAALNAFRMQAMLQGMVADMSDPSAVLHELNEKLLGLLSPGQFATMFYAIINIFEDALCYAAAGSTDPALLRPGNSVEWLEGRGLPLGISAKAQYQNITVPFPPGDGLLIYSDALTETPNSRGQHLTVDDLLPCLQMPNHGEAFFCLIDHYGKHRSGAISDDLTIALLSRKLSN